MRCSRHSLACGADGLCVLCRKDVPKAANGNGLVHACVGAAMLALGGAVGYRELMPRPAADMAGEVRPPGSTRDTTAPVRPAPAVDRPSGDVSAIAQSREEAFRKFQEDLAAGRASGGPAAPPSPPDRAPAPEIAPPAPTPAPPSIDDVRVVVYTAPWCGVCRRAKAWMSARGIAYEERDIEASNENARMNRTLNPRGSIPTFDVEGDILVGFSEGGLLATMQRAAQRRSARSY